MANLPPAFSLHPLASVPLSPSLNLKFLTSDPILNLSFGTEYLMFTHGLPGYDIEYLSYTVWLDLVTILIALYYFGITSPIASLSLLIFVLLDLIVPQMSCLVVPRVMD